MVILPRVQISQDFSILPTDSVPCSAEAQTTDSDEVLKALGKL
jgi:hypothetical protein